MLIESNGFLPPAKNAKRWPWMGKAGEILLNGQGSALTVADIAIPKEDSTPASAEAPTSPETDATSSSSPQSSPNHADTSLPPLAGNKKKKKKKSKAKPVEFVALSQAISQELESLSLGTKAAA